MNYHPDVLAAHAEFGGDLQAMQALYDRPDHIARIAALEAQLAEAKGRLNEIACWSQSQSLLWWQVTAREALSALEATPPAPKDPWPVHYANTTAPGRFTQPAPKVTEAMVVFERKIGMYGQAFDPVGTHRAYTYEHQPNNQAAWRLGGASPAPFDGTDHIDRGLSLLKALNENGFGVFEIEPLATLTAAQEAGK